MTKISLVRLRALQRREEDKKSIVVTLEFIIKRARRPRRRPVSRPVSRPARHILHMYIKQNLELYNANPASSEPFSTSIHPIFTRRRVVPVDGRTPVRPNASESHPFIISIPTNERARSSRLERRVWNTPKKI